MKNNIKIASIMIFAVLFMGAVTKIDLATQATGIMPHSSLPTLVSGDIPNNSANTSGTAANLSGTPALPNGTTASTQSALDNTTKIATDAFVLANAITNASYLDNEVVAGTINGTNPTFTLANTPVSGSVSLYLNGVLQQSGAGNDYTISGLTITMLNIPVSGDKLLANYRK